MNSEIDARRETVGSSICTAVSSRHQQSVLSIPQSRKCLCGLNNYELQVFSRFVKIQIQSNTLRMYVNTLKMQKFTITIILGKSAEVKDCDFFHIVFYLKSKNAV